MEKQQFLKGAKVVKRSATISSVSSVMKNRTAFLITLFVSVLFFAIEAKATLITFSTGGVDTFTVPSITDLIRVDGQGSTTLNLELGVPVQATINNLYFYVNPLDWWSGTYNFSVNRTMTIGTETKILNQSGAVYLGFVRDSARVFTSTAPTYFNISEGIIKVTPQTVGTNGQRIGEGGNYSIQAMFELAPIPEPATMLLLGLGGILVRSKVKRKN